MESLIGIQRWLYGGVSAGLADVAAGNIAAVAAAMALALVFGAVHALMPGHGKTVLVSYHLGQPGRWRDGLATGALLALTHVGMAIVLVLAGVAVISRAFASGGRTPNFEIASAVLITLIGLLLLWQALRRRPHSHPGSGKALALVTGLVPCPLTTFVMSYALVHGMLIAGLVVTAAMATGMVATIAAFAIAAVLARGPLMVFLARTQALRHRAGRVLEIGSAVAVLVLGLWSLLPRLAL
jgi:ABC-type nickel/cobalt efflux system permease component RcnA